MENNLDSALEYLKSKSVRNEDFMDDGMVAYIANHLVGYAASVSPKLVLPERIEKAQYEHELDDWDSGYNFFRSEFIRLNPSLFK